MILNHTDHAKILKGPLQIQFDITNKCNFRCLHCYNKSGENFVCNNELTDNEIIRFIKDVKELKPFNICFCGGEPLLKLNLLLKASKILKNTVPNISIVTNGYLLTDEILLKLVDSGINRIQISLDGNSKEVHELLRQKEGAFSKAISAIEICLKHKTKLKEIMICFSPTSFNIKDFSSVVERVFSMGVDGVRVQPLMISGRGKDNESLINPKPYQYQYLLNEIQLLRDIYGITKIEWGDPVDHIIRFRTYLSDVCTNITIQANGEIIATPYIPISFGNIKRHSIVDYWKSGLASIWKNEILQEYAKHINVLSDIGKKIDGFPTLWEDENLNLDILEER